MDPSLWLREAQASASGAEAGEGARSSAGPSGASAGGALAGGGREPPPQWLGWKQRWRRLANYYCGGG